MTQRVAGLTMLAEYIGDEATEKLRAAFGGCQVKVPKTRAGSWWQRLVETLGERDAADFCEAFGGETVYIPRNAGEERDAIRRQVRDMLAAGMTYLEIARTLTWTVRYTERGLRKMMEARCAAAARRADDPRQMSLLPHDALRDAMFFSAERVPADARLTAAHHAGHGDI
ncbi:hypothetical protein EDC36_12028 [Tepidimonas ignava]|uniref:Mor transcription activator family protein n=1 Tax=Tepidimonas ignava TaxID=114249 RepID=A0A4R3L9E1_9BURK|nr:hypothetical protein [Tepidimonas ignava]TCS94106.1 hypothetical protein EDC36_12028 [Tepidimonas ignava]TSE18932.1 Mor transcription activator family protein [Tepidimonas ignava]